MIVLIPPGYVQASGSYTADWQRWSQGASGYSAMKYGCRVTAYSKMLAEAGYAGFGNPDGFFEWGKGKGYFRASDTCELTSIGVAPVTYVNSNGGTASLAGRQTLTGNKTTDANTIMNLINQGYYVVLTCSAHSAYVGRADSISQGTAVILDSWASAKVGSSFQYRNYTLYTFTTANYFRITDNSAINNPKGCLDNAEGGTNTVRVTGWAFDPNAVSQSIEIHVYIGGPAGVGEGHGGIIANTCREDVNNVYGTGIYHGFDATIRTSLTGTQTVYVYAINIGAGTNQLIGTKTVNISKDTTAPTISDVRVTDINANGYTVTCKVEDAGGVSRVQFPSWTVTNDQDDLAADWINNPVCRGTQSGTTWSYRVNTSDHNNEEGFYRTHIYAWDTAGNCNSEGVYDVYIDRTPPVISEVEIVDMDVTGYTVCCTVTDDIEVGKVQFPTWTVDNDQDDLAGSWWDNPSCRGAQDGTTWSFRVNDREHNFERGIYRTHIYAYDKHGNSACYGLNNIEFENRYCEVNTAFYNGHTYCLYNDCLTWNEAKEKCEELDGHLVTILSEDEQEVVAKLVEEQERVGYWIGGRKDGDSTWVTGEEFAYNNWDPGEPNEIDGEDCYGIYTDRGTWNDWLNTKQGLGFICEWDFEKAGELENPETELQIKSENVRLSKMSVAWSGKAQTPPIIVKDNQGRTISSAHYTVTYRNNKNVGQATVTITFKNGYAGTIKKTFTIKPKDTSISKVSALNKGFTVKWKKQKSQTTGYEIQYSTSSKFKGAKTLTNIKAKNTSKKVTKLKARKKYYVRIRTYKTVKMNGKSTKIYSDWSKVKSVVTKK